MASRKLARMKIDPVIIGRLTAKQISTPVDLFQKNQYELISLLDATEDEVTAIFGAVSTAIIPPPKTALQLLSEAKGPQFTLDAKAQIPALRIGSGITEFVGAAGAGKSQICMQLSAVVAASGGGVLFFDTEQTFAANRILQIARARYPGLLRTPSSAPFAAPSEADPLALKVTVFKDTASDKLYSRLQSIEETIIENNIKLIVVDSIAALVRVEFDREHMPQRQERLGAIASQLKYLGEQFRIPIVVTNQMTTKAIAASGAADSKSTTYRLDAALGVGWAHAVNSRFWIEDYQPLEITASRIGYSTVCGTNALRRSDPVSPRSPHSPHSMCCGVQINDGGLDFDACNPTTVNAGSGVGGSGSGSSGGASKPQQTV